MLTECWKLRRRADTHPLYNGPVNQFTMFLSLILTSLLLIQATTTPSTYKDIDDEMRSYVREAAARMGVNPEEFASHVTPTSSLASQRYYKGNYASFYIVTFDREFIERQNVRVKKAIAAHEVGHAYPSCAVLSNAHYYGVATYLDKENCADILSAVLSNYEWAMEALQRIKRESPDTIDIDNRINLLKEQLGTPEEDLTYWDE